MCKKQCRDENGFKNHCTTENHLRNMERFAADSDKYIDQFSREFEKAYLDLLSHHHHTKRMNANYVYNELIQDKSHIHMNATRWDSLASFVKHLGASGKCEVDETERGWFVRWIDPEERARDAARRKRDEEEAKAQERRMKALLLRQQQVADNLAKDHAGTEEYLVQDPSTDEKMVLNGPTAKRIKTSGGGLALFDAAQDDQDGGPVPEHAAETVDQDDATPTWLMPEVIVRIASSKVGVGLKNEKAVVLDVRDDAADLIMLKTGQEVLNVPSKRLETVIPKLGGKVMMLGLHAKRGSLGTIQSLDQEDSKAVVRLENGETLTVEFEDISKVFEEAGDNT